MFLFLLATAADPFFPDVPWQIAAAIATALTGAIGVLWARGVKLSDRNEKLLRETLQSEKDSAIHERDVAKALESLKTAVYAMRDELMRDRGS